MAFLYFQLKQNKPGRRIRGLTAGREQQIGKLVVTVERPKFIGNAKAEGTFGEGGVGDTLGFFRDCRIRLGLEWHR